MSKLLGRVWEDNLAGRVMVDPSKLKWKGSAEERVRKLASGKRRVFVRLPSFYNYRSFCTGTSSEADKSDD